MNNPFTMNLKQIPKYETKTKHDKANPSYYVTIKNVRTGYTKFVTRAKAYSYINRPALVTLQREAKMLKDSWELV